MSELRMIIQEIFKNKNVLVLGDMMVDEYVTGKVKRISPEAPVPVLNFSSTTRTAGGASNVVKNVKNLGAHVWAAGVAANDEAGKWLREDFEKLGVEVDGIIVSEDRPTILKTRYATKGQQLLRVDNEICADIPRKIKDDIINFIEKHIDSLDAVILSDYCKGVFSDGLFVRKIIELCKAHNVFVSIDSKSKEIEYFTGADFVKPNNLELEAAVGVQIVDDDSFNKAGNIYLEKSGIQTLIVTRGAKGISVFQNGKERLDFAAAEEVQVFDVTGAGDTVISTMTMSLISGTDIEEAAKLANIAAGVVISKVGTVAISRKELLYHI